jgi:hypothetical protein
MNIFESDPTAEAVGYFQPSASPTFAAKPLKFGKNDFRAARWTLTFARDKS